MFARLSSLGVAALEGFVVSTEVDLSGGLPQFAIVGLPDNAVKEATDRVRSALKNMGFEYPVSRVTVNLAPANVRKTGPVYDLPVLLGLLVASKQLPLPGKDMAFLGELSLDGQVRPVDGVLPMALACKSAGIRRLFLPAGNAREAALAEGIQVYPVRAAGDVIDHLKGEKEIIPAAPTQLELGSGLLDVPDFSDVYGQPEARRAMEIAAAGMHNVLLVGAPGAGKSMLAKRLPGILPPMTQAEAIRTSEIYSVGGLLGKQEDLQLVTRRPFRSPHHGVSSVALAGGGGGACLPKPGEISYAHNGVLFLDELPEFSRDALEVLRQPLEDGVIHISRVGGTAAYPARFMLAAAMNPCPCGYHGHPTRECRCLPTAIERYMSKVSGPLLDRIDLHVEVQPMEYEDISAAQGGEPSAVIRARVLEARKFQQQRGGTGEPMPNTLLEGDALREQTPLSNKAADMMKVAFERMGLSARGYDRVLRVSRTIADLGQSEVVQAEHVAEAVQYRNMDRRYCHFR